MVWYKYIRVLEEQVFSISVKMETVASFETMVNFHQTIWHHIPENGNLQTLDVFHVRIVLNTVIVTVSQRD